MTSDAKPVRPIDTVKIGTPLLVGIILAVATPAIAVGVVASGVAGPDNEQTPAVSLDGPVTSVVLEGFNGSVKVTGDKSVSGVMGRAIVDWHKGVEPVIVPRVANGVAILTYSLPPGTDHNDRGVGWDVMVPPGVSVSVATSNGSATVIGVGGDVTVATSNAAIDAAGLGDGKASFTTTNGSIDARFIGAPPTIQADSTNGSVTVTTDGKTPYFDRTTTTNGTVVTKNPGAEDYTLAPNRMITVKTTNGDVAIR